MPNFPGHSWQKKLPLASYRPSTQHCDEEQIWWKPKPLAQSNDPGAAVAVGVERYQDIGSGFNAGLLCDPCVVLPCYVQPILGLVGSGCLKFAGKHDYFT